MNHIISSLLKRRSMTYASRVIIAAVSFKGGVGKSTVSVHLAALLNERAPALLVDADLNRSVLAWSRRGHLPFKVIDEKQAAKYSREFENIVIDTAARMPRAELEALADGSDLVILVTECDALSIDAALAAVQELKTLGAGFRVLLNAVPPVGTAGQDAYQALTAAGLPVLRSRIRRFAAYGKAALHGSTVDQVSDPYASTAWSDVVALGRELNL